MCILRIVLGRTSFAKCFAAEPDEADTSAGPKVVFETRVPAATKPQTMANNHVSSRLRSAMCSGGTLSGRSQMSPSSQSASRQAGRRRAGLPVTLVGHDRQQCAHTYPRAGRETYL
eukprot:scaffold75170_cov97-Phaeocystis_antarctica.AAC.1